jgi:hypothetical protein
MSDAITSASAGISFTLLDPCLTFAPSCGELAAFRLRFTGSYISAKYEPAEQKGSVDRVSLCL